MEHHLEWRKSGLSEWERDFLRGSGTSESSALREHASSVERHLFRVPKNLLNEKLLKLQNMEFSIHSKEEERYLPSLFFFGKMILVLYPLSEVDQLPTEI